MDINDIPSEIILYTLSFIPQKDILYYIYNVCSSWRVYCQSAYLWKRVQTILVRDRDSDKILRKMVKLKLARLIENLEITEANFLKLIKYDSNVRFENMHTLDISYEALRNEATFIEIRERCPCLEKIKIWTSPYVDMKLPFTHLSKLKLVDVNIHYFTDETTETNFDKYLQSFVATQSLVKRLSLTICHDIKETVISNCMSSLPLITSFSISNRYFNGVNLQQSNTPVNLTEFSMRSDLFHDEDLDRVTRQCKHLRIIHIKNCEKLTDKGLCSIGQHCPVLEELIFGDNMVTNASITNSTVLSIAAGCKRLKHFETYSIWNIDDTSIVQLASSCTMLQKIWFEEGSAITDLSLEAIGDNCPSLRFVHLSECSTISLNGVVYMVSHCKQIKHLTLKDCLRLDVSDSQPMKSPERPSSDLIAGTKASDQQWDFSSFQLIKDQEQPQRYFATNAKQDGYCDMNIGLSNVDITKQDVGVIDLATIDHHCHLIVLNLHRCRISNTGLLRLTKHCPDIRYISLCDSSIDTSDVEFKEQLYNNCKLLVTQL